MRLFNRIMIFLSITGLVVTLVLSLNAKVEYKTIWILPLFYTLAYVGVFQFVFQNKSIRITSVTLSILLFFKAVMNPVLITMAGPNYPGKRYIPLSIDSIEFAIILSAFEIIMVAFFIFIMSITVKRDINLRFQKNWSLRGSKLIYLLFITAAVFIYIIFGRNANILSFLAFSLSGEGYVGVGNTMLILVRQITVTAVAIIFIMIVNHCREKYLKAGNKKYINIAILAAIMNIGVIVGNRRSVQLFTGILSIWILTKTFKTNRKRIILVILASVSFVFGLMTLYRWGAYQYGSYLGAVTSTSANVNIGWMADYAQIYFGGPDSLATSIVFSENVDLSLKNLIFDFGRTFFGISFLLKDKMYLTSELYNLYLYRGRQLTGQLIFSTSYGYMFFGFIGAPVIMMLNTSISILFEKLFRKSKSYETAYLFGYCLLRMALNLLTNTPTIISIITQQLGTLGLLILFARLFVKKRSNGQNIQRNVT